MEPQIELAHSKGLNERELKELQQLIVEKEDEIRSRWNEHFGSGGN